MAGRRESRQTRVREVPARRVDDQPPPHNDEAEMAVLGTLLAFPERFEDIVPALCPEDFYATRNRFVYAVVRDELQIRGTVDTVLARAALHARGQLTEVGESYLAKLTDGVPRSTNIVHYASLVREHALRRSWLRLTQAARVKVYAGEDSLVSLLEQIQEQEAALASTASVARFRNLRALTCAGHDLLERLCANHQEITGVATGFPDLDRLTRGLQPGEVIVIAARPSMGKTSWLTNVARYAGGLLGGQVALFSLEMGWEQLWLRLLAAEARVDGMRLACGRLNPEEWAACSVAMNTLGDTSLWIDDAGDQTVPAIRAKARTLQATQGLTLVVIDYLQLLRSPTPGENRNLELAAMTRGLKVLAKDLKVPVLVASQLSRECERRGDKRPLLSDLRDSGAIEQDADVVLLLYREEVYTKQRPGEAELIVAKNRNGPIGTVDLVWRQGETRFLSRVSEAVERRRDAWMEA